MLKHFIFFLTFVGFLNSNAQKQNITLHAISDFKQVSQKNHVSFYVHKYKKALAINAGKHKGKFAIAQATKTIAKGTYQVTITTLGEIDGESTYRLFVNDQQVAEQQNQPTEKDYQPQTLNFGTIKIPKKATIKIAFNSHTNGKIPEGNGTAFSRGRWTQLTLTPLD